MKPRQNFTEDTLNSVIAQNARDVRIHKKRTGALATGDISALSIGPNIRILTGRLYGQQPFEATVHAEPGLAIEIRLKGQSRSFDLHDPGRHIEVGPGSCVITTSPKRSTWQVLVPNQAEFETVTFEFIGDFIEDFARVDGDYASALRMFCARPAVLQLRPHAGLQALAARALDLAGHGSEEQALRGYSIIVEMLLVLRPHFLNNTPRAIKPAEALADRARAFIEAHASAALTLGQVGSELRVSPSSIKTALAKTLRSGFKELLQATLMARAARMIEDGAPISRVADALGYSSPEALTKGFRRFYGYPPRDHLRTALSVRTEI